MVNLLDYYKKLMEERGYESIEEMLNDLSLNYEDVFEDEEE